MLCAGSPHRHRQGLERVFGVEANSEHIPNLLLAGEGLIGTNNFNIIILDNL
jgi:hypothetical protein